jgi:hypothetical protein
MSGMLVSRSWRAVARLTSISEGDALEGLLRVILLTAAPDMMAVLLWVGWSGEEGGRERQKGRRRGRKVDRQAQVWVPVTAGNWRESARSL